MISNEEYEELVATTHAFQHGQAVRRLIEEKKTMEMDLRVEEWIRYRDSLPRLARIAAVRAYRKSFG